MWFAAGCLALALALASAPARADQRSVFDSSDFAERIGAGPVLAGGEVLWSAEVNRGERLFSAPAGGRPRPRQVLAPPPDFDGDYESGSDVERLTASPDHVAYVRAGYSELKGKLEANGRTDESSWLADPGRPPTRLFACGSDVASASVALDGTLPRTPSAAAGPARREEHDAAPRVDDAPGAPRALTGARDRA